MRHFRFDQSLTSGRPDVGSSQKEQISPTVSNSRLSRSIGIDSCSSEKNEYSLSFVGFNEKEIELSIQNSIRVNLLFFT